MTLLTQVYEMITGGAPNFDLVKNIQRFLQDHSENSLRDSTSTTTVN